MKKLPKHELPGPSLINKSLIVVNAKRTRERVPLLSTSRRESNSRKMSTEYSERGGEEFPRKKLSVREQIDDYPTKKGHACPHCKRLFSFDEVRLTPVPIPTVSIPTQTDFQAHLAKTLSLLEFKLEEIAIFAGEQQQRALALEERAQEHAQSAEQFRVRLE